MSAPDIVYVVRAADKNEELRYSLRSLVNVLAFMGAGVAAVFVLRHVF